eukprot:13584865-Alexandrium_andersonii.AAC.1
MTWSEPHARQVALLRRSLRPLTPLRRDAVDDGQLADQHAGQVLGSMGDIRRLRTWPWGLGRDLCCASRAASLAPSWGVARRRWQPWGH